MDKINQSPIANPDAINKAVEVYYAIPDVLGGREIVTKIIEAYESAKQQGAQITYDDK